MLLLTPDKLIARGWHRECYLHPDNPDLCIKVVVNGDETETRREQAYYRYIQRRLKHWDSVPAFHGQVMTNLGDGAIFELIRDADGSVSKTLGYYLKSSNHFSTYQSQLLDGLRRLFEYQIQYNIVTMSLKENNLLFQRTSTEQGNIFIIDNLGNAELIPVSTYFRYFGTRKIRRKWLKFSRLLKQQYPNLEIWGEALDALYR